MGSRSNKNSGPRFAARITPTGHLYVQAEAAMRKAVAQAAGTQHPPFCPSCSGAAATTPNTTTTPKSRKLLVWGADGRTKVKKATFPYSAVGQLVGVDASWQGYTCSGALFGPSYVLTAGVRSCHGCCLCSVCQVHCSGTGLNARRWAAWWAGTPRAYEKWLLCVASAKALGGWQGRKGL